MNERKRKTARRRYLAKFKARRKYEQNEEYRKNVNEKGMKNVNEGEKNENEE